MFSEQQLRRRGTLVGGIQMHPGSDARGRVDPSDAYFREQPARSCQRGAAAHGPRRRWRAVSTVLPVPFGRDSVRLTFARAALLTRRSTARTSSKGCVSSRGVLRGSALTHSLFLTEQDVGSVLVRGCRECQELVCVCRSDTIVTTVHARVVGDDMMCLIMNIDVLRCRSHCLQSLVHERSEHCCR